MTGDERDKNEKELQAKISALLTALTRLVETATTWLEKKQ